MYGRRTYVVWVPRNVAHASSPAHGHTGAAEPLHSAHSTRTATVRQGSNFPLPSQIPYNRVSCAARGSQRVLDVMVPR